MSKINLEKSFKVACAMRDTTKSDLAEKLNVSKALLTNVTAGRSGMSVSKLQDVCSVLNMKVSEFVALGENNGN